MGVSPAARQMRWAPDGQLVGERTSSGTRYAVLDALGSTRWLLSGNTISKSYTYTPDGDSTASGSGADTRIRFAGGDLTTSGRYHFGARYYQPGIARWTQRDPLDQSSDLAEANPYLYASSNPVNRIDPSGLVPADSPGPSGPGSKTPYKCLEGEFPNCTNPNDDAFKDAAGFLIGVGSCAYGIVKKRNVQAASVSATRPRPRFVQEAC